MSRAHVVFACVHNAGRSQMAAAFFRALADPAKAEGTSAGTRPGPHVHPEVVEAMREAGIEVWQAGLLPQDKAREVQTLRAAGTGQQAHTDLHQAHIALQVGHAAGAMHRGVRGRALFARREFRI